MGEAIHPVENALTGQQLGLGELGGGDGVGQAVGLGFEVLEHGQGGGGIDAVGDGVVQVGDFAVDAGLLGTEGCEDRVLLCGLLLGQDEICQAADDVGVQGYVEKVVDDGLLDDFLADGPLVAGLAVLVIVAGIVIVGVSGAAGAAIADHGCTAVAAEQLACQEKIDRAFALAFLTLGQLTLNLLPLFAGDDGGHSAFVAIITPDINTGIPFVVQNMQKNIIGEGAARSGEAPGVQLTEDRGAAHAGEIPVIDLPDDGSLCGIDDIMAIRAGRITIIGIAVIEAFRCVVMHATGDIFREVPGVPFGGSLQHSLQEHAGGALGDGLHGVDDADTPLAQTALVDGGVLAAAAEAVHLPDDDRAEGAGLGGLHHGVEGHAGVNVAEAGLGVVGVLMDDGVSLALGIGVDVAQLLLDGYVPLTGGGVAGIGHGALLHVGRELLGLGRGGHLLTGKGQNTKRRQSGQEPAGKREISRKN
ncbi:MAG: hypothetical protein SOY30_09405 [Eubacteriales bacterium]|nr:hypothetical protein [Eubacteriales bacterium]